MRSKLLRALVGGLIAFVALGLAACGGDDNESVSSEQAKYAPPTAAPDDAQQGGELTVLAAGDVDYIDPGAAYYQFSYMITGATQRGLVSWQPGDTETPTPDLADSDPEVSSDFKTITYHLKHGIRFSPPVNREATAQDVKYAIERQFLPGVSNGYANIYFTALEGYDDAVKAIEKDPTTAPDIKGIETPDKYTVIFHLSTTDEALVDGALSLPGSAPVPEEYAKPFDAEKISTYGTHQVATGPYMIKNDCVDDTGKVVNKNCSGELTGYSPGKEINLVRNANWDASTDFRPAYLDTVKVQEGFTDTVSATRKILTGSHMVNGDYGLPASSLKEAATKYPDQLTLTQSGANRYVALNTSKPPFDDINIRKAVIANSDREALRATRGGPLVGEVATHFIPPGIPGFEEAGGVAGPQGPEFDFVQNTKGDPDVAAKYMKAAGFESGKCEGSVCDITMVGDNAPPGKDTATVVKDQLEQLGFNVNFQPVDHDLMYTKFCSIPENAPNVCPNVGWIKDFEDGQAMVDIPFNGESINPKNTSNWPYLDDPKLNKAIDAARHVSDPSQRPEVLGKLDDQVTALAPAIPWIWDNQSNVSSNDVATVINLFNADTDLSFTSLAK
jgi:peptide/nickel transport system substrate-binding protein